MGYNNRRAVMLTLIALVALIGMVSCIVIKSKPSGTPVPTSTEQVEEVETPDCDKEDIRNKDVADCGIGVLIPTARKTPAKPRKTRR